MNEWLVTLVDFRLVSAAFLSQSDELGMDLRYL